MTHDKLWPQLIEGISNIILSRRCDESGTGRVPYAFEVFHMDISESEGVSEALQQLETVSGMGVVIGLYLTNTKKEGKYKSTGNKTKLLEYWRLQQAKIPTQQTRVNDLTNVRLLIRSIYATCRMLPYHRNMAKLHAVKGSTIGFFISPIETWDSQSGVICGCSSDPELLGTQIRFDSQVEKKSFAPVAYDRRGNSHSATVSVEYATFFPELESSLDEGSPKFSIIGDYVNRRPDSASIPVPFAKTQAQQNTVPISSPTMHRDPTSKSMPVQIPVKAQNTPPPSFAPTPPGSFQSGSSLTKLFQHGGFHRYESVSPSESSLSQWTPRLENNSIGNGAPWIPKTKEIPIRKYGSSHIDVNTYSAFLEDDFDDELIDDGSDSQIETTDDDISKFRERMEKVTLTEGFATLNSRGSETSPFTIKNNDKIISISDITSTLLELKQDFISASEGKA